MVSMKRIALAVILISVIVIAGATGIILSQTENHPTEISDYSNTTVLTDYTVTIPEIYKMTFGVAEINMKFIAPSPSLQEQLLVSEANFTTTILPITFSTEPTNTSNLTLPAIFNGTTIEITVDVYQYTMIKKNPRIFVTSQQWNETKYNYT